MLTLEESLQLTEPDGFNGYRIIELTDEDGTCWYPQIDMTKRNNYTAVNGYVKGWAYLCWNARGSNAVFNNPVEAIKWTIRRIHEMEGM